MMRKRVEGYATLETRMLVASKSYNKPFPKNGEKANRLMPP